MVRRPGLWHPRWRLSGRKGLGVVIGSRRSRYYGDVKNDEETNELDKHCNAGCGVRQEKVQIEIDHWQVQV